MTDGGARRDIHLDARQIRAGKFMYAPAHEDVGVRLILFDKDQGTGDSVRIKSIPNVADRGECSAAVRGPTRQTARSTLRRRPARRPPLRCTKCSPSSRRESVPADRRGGDSGFVQVNTSGSSARHSQGNFPR